MSKPESNSPLSYKDAGVDIDAGNQLVDNIKSITKATKRPEVLGGLGGFGALCELPSKYKDPLLVSGTDGVGTKLKLAMDTGKHDTVGIDLVAMCVNDLIVCGAEPLFFLDYYATGKLEIDVATDVIKGIGEGCQQSGCALVGGETAEMPGMYQKGDYDLAGFCVGVVERDGLIDGSKVSAGDKLIGIESSGPHSNGFSLIRKILEREEEAMKDKGLISSLMEPTRIYVKSILELMKQIEIHALAHITGGGFTENLPRVLPEGCNAEIDLSSWETPNCFRWLQEKGQVEPMEMLKTFNCGIGMIVVVNEAEADKALQSLETLGEKAHLIGQVLEGRPGSERVSYINQ